MNTCTWMRRAAWAGLVLALVLGWGAVAPANEEPLTQGWAPTKWGADDKIGAMNMLTPDMVLRSVKLIKRGKWATLGKVYQSDMPFFGPRIFKLTIPGLPTGGPFGEHEAVYNDEMVTTEIGQVGTQFDGPGHIGVITSQGVFHYNGAMLGEVGSSYGLGRLGVDHVGQKGYVCRGVLLDAAGYRGVERLRVPQASDPDDPGIITDDDVRAMVQRQRIAPIGAGDCVFLHTGHGNLWHPTDWDRYDAEEKRRRIAEFNSGEPGFGISACSYLQRQGVVLIGADSWATEAVPGENAQRPFECHVQLQTRHGVWNIENLDLTQLVADRAYEFLFVWAPLKIKGATGSPGNPIAIY